MKAKLIEAEAFHAHLHNHGQLWDIFIIILCFYTWIMPNHNNGTDCKQLEKLKKSFFLFRDGHLFARCGLVD